jgi:hypothetical protein
MRTITRTLIILFFVAIVVVGIYFLGTSDWADEFLPTGRQLGSGGRNQADSSSQESGQGFRHGQKEGSSSGGHNHADLEGTIDILSMTEFLKTLIPFAIIIAVVSYVRRLLNSARRKRRRSTA